MSAPSSNGHDAVLDRIIDSLGGGEPFDRAQGMSLDAQLQADSLLELEHAAAAVACVSASMLSEPMPDALRQRCSGAARAVLSQPSAPEFADRHQPKPSLRFTPDAPERPRRNGLGLGWLAAAACLAIAAVAWWPSQQAVTPTAEQNMVALIETAQDLTRWDWSPWDPALEGVTGEVVWSESAQEGYMVLEGLAVNDASAEQYQLWVVESSRGTPLEVPPVDGGVFDIAEPGRAVIPIRCAIPARGVVAFAVTREQPGGVVVSDQAGKVVIAQAPAAG